MKKIVLVVLALIFTLTVFHSCVEPLTEEPAVDELALKSANGLKSYIVVLNDTELNTELVRLTGYEARQNATKKAAEKIMKRAGITDCELGFVYGTALQGFSVKIPPGQLKKLQDDPSVKYMEEDQVVTLIQPDLKINGKPVKPAPSQSTPWGIDRVNGGISYSGQNKIWIIDTGIDLDHPDLNVDKSNGWNFIANTQTADDDNGHGSHCAGIAAAVNNNIGVIGVAAGASVVPVKVLNKRGSGSYSTIIAGVDWVAAKGVVGDVANMSLGGPEDEALNEAVINASAKVKFALAAGNESTSATTKSPASANGANIYTISAMASGDVWASYSNYGNPPVDYCEPGSSIYSTYKGGGYATMSGTSMAAPHAAGLLLLGSIRSGGTVTGDPDGNPDTIGIH
ncbi:MAG: S8 family peptidase [Bacteroidia bacterium]|nr:S8 family peptidase [Bacteroidia bacterium]